VIDIDVENLARVQATRQRDVILAEEMQDDADVSDELRERRDLERQHSSERRREQTEDDLKRRRAELEHAKALRQVKRRRTARELENEVREWKDQVEAERAKLKAEELEKEAGKKSEDR
jgi:hypothetical protein